LVHGAQQAAHGAVEQGLVVARVFLEGREGARGEAVGKSVGM